MKIYTRAGDGGLTCLLGGARVRKDVARLEAAGAVDELNAALGLALAYLQGPALPARAWLEAVQSDLFILGTMLATPPTATQHRATLPPHRTASLEQHIDQMEEALTPLKHFILPQGSACSAAAHVARAICRRAERRTVALAAQERIDRDALVYLNRLSDFLFVLARWISAQEGTPETAWTYDEVDGAKLVESGSAAKDRLDVTLKKLDQEKEARKTLFEKAAGDLARKKEHAQKLFQQNVEKAKQEGPAPKPLRDIDL